MKKYKEEIAISQNKATISTRNGELETYDLTQSSDLAQAQKRAHLLGFDLQQIDWTQAARCSSYRYTS